MMTDRYTKVVLTVIAVALSIIAARDVIVVGVAQEPAHVIIDHVGSSAASYYALPVKIKN